MFNQTVENNIIKINIILGCDMIFLRKKEKCVETDLLENNLHSI